MRSLEELDRWIAGQVKRWTSRVSGPAHKPELLEIRRDILESIRDQIEPAGAGRQVFPYNTVAIRIAPPSPDDVTLYRAAFGESGSLDQDIRGLLTEAGCPAPAGFRVEVEIVEDASLSSSAQPFHIECFERKAGAEPKIVVQRPGAKLIVVRGEAEPAELAITSDRINIGRLREVMGERQGLRRRNDLAFAETETTVSREHGYIRYDTSTGRFRLYDSQSQRGASIFREGRRIEVPRSSTRGVQLQTGDEIHFGDARVRFETESS
jgi:FHA domain-containing protein